LASKNSSFPVSVNMMISNRIRNTLC